MRFWVMNKDKKVAIANCIGNHIYFEQILDQNLLTNMNTILYDVDSWLMSRTNFIGRKNIIALQKHVGIYNRESLLFVGKGLSINDTIWFNSIDKPIEWSKINPFINPFNLAIANIALNCEYSGGDLKSPSPEYLTGGSFEKCCKRINKEIVLVKNSGEKFSSITGNGAESEVIYTQLCEALNIPKDTYVDYRLQVKDMYEYSICKIFTNENIGYIEFGDTKYRDIGIENTIKLFDRTIFGSQFRDMIILDAITFNIDRHRGNYGFLIDNDTFKIIGLAPNFDYNWSCLPNISMKQSRDDLSKKLVNLHNRSMNNSFLNLAKLAMYANMLERIKNLAGNFRFDVSRLGHINEFDENRSKMLELILNTQMKRIIGACN